MVDRDETGAPGHALEVIKHGDPEYRDAEAKAAAGLPGYGLRPPATQGGVAGGSGHNVAAAPNLPSWEGVGYEAVASATAEPGAATLVRGAPGAGTDDCCERAGVTGIRAIAAAQAARRLENFMGQISPVERARYVLP